ncbi:hypothetical protein [Streptomyces uncialis]|uniref:hypothetical protein n=2 Tax=Streptomyces uncialis TaxID=1048205 RepID=UPI0015BF0E28|nr:hypothetical protein [Streptomyces uncialis]MCX4661552.1 hypothetical protein [Streptomyces uncialis]
MRAAHKEPAEVCRIVHEPMLSVRPGGTSRSRALHWNGPLMTGVWMELCPACAARRPAARALSRIRHSNVWLW